MIIADLGSGNTCKNNIDIARRMIFEIAQCRIPGLVIKWQLFTKAGDNLPLDKNIFDSVYNYAMINFGIPTTASVFDKESLDFLLTYNVPFIKIANSPASQELKKHVKDKRVIVSSDTGDDDLCCISKYPATAKEYETKFGDKLKKGISDHTKDFSLFAKYHPKIYEFHFKLEDSAGLDAGEFARTSAQIKEWLAPKKIDLAEVLRTAE